MKRGCKFAPCTLQELTYNYIRLHQTSAKVYNCQFWQNHFSIFFDFRLEIRAAYAVCISFLNRKHALNFGIIFFTNNLKFKVMETKVNKLVNEDVVTRLKICIDNSYDIYLVTEWLSNCVVKRMKKGLPVLVDRLANCSSMHKIVSAAAKMLLDCGIKATNAEKAELRYRHAAYIIEKANYLLS